jgi:hypothetical protein
MDVREAALTEAPKHRRLIRSAGRGRLLSAAMLPFVLMFPPSGYAVITTTGRKTGKHRRKCIRVARLGQTVYILQLRPPELAIVRPTSSPRGSGTCAPTRTSSCGCAAGPSGAPAYRWPSTSSTSGSSELEIVREVGQALGATRRSSTGPRSAPRAVAARFRGRARGRSRRAGPRPAASRAAWGGRAPETDRTRARGEPFRGRRGARLRRPARALRGRARASP